MSCGGNKKGNANAQHISDCVAELKHAVETRGDDTSLVNTKMGKTVFHRLLQQKKREMGLGYGEGTPDQQQEAEAWARAHLAENLEAEYTAAKTLAENPEAAAAAKQDWKAKQEAKNLAAAEAYVKGIEEITNGEDFQKLLAYAADIRGYSFGNSMMIAMQHQARIIRAERTGETPPPSSLGLIMSRTNWAKKGREPKSGESGYDILVPRMVKGRYYEDGSGKRVFLKKGENPPNGEQVKTGESRVGWMIRETYASYQTDGDPIPEYPKPEIHKGDSYPGLKEALEETVKENGFTIEYVPPDDPRLHGADGVTIPSEKAIYVRDDRDPLERDTITAHEVGHMILHGKGDDDHGKSLCRGEKELEAEGVKFVIMHRLGIDTGSSAFKYSAGWSTAIKGTAEKRASFFRAMFDRMGKASNSVLDKLPQANG